MGDLSGHILPGTFFGLFATWWTWSIFHRYFICLFEKRNEERRMRSHNIKYKNTLCFSCTWSCTRIPLEGIIKATLSFIGVIAEFTSLAVIDNFSTLTQPQHMLMYTFFGLNGIVDVLMHYKFPLPPDTDYITGFIALLMEGFLFYFHLHDRSQLDIQIHMFLVLAIFGTLIATALEMKLRNNVLPALGRTYFTLLQCTWFWQVGFILYPPIGEPWDGKSHQSLMLSVIVFSCHNLGIFIFLSVFGAVIYCRVGRMSENTRKRMIFSFREPLIKKFFPSFEEASNILLESEEEVVTSTH